MGYWELIVAALQVGCILALATVPITSLLLFRDSLRNASSETIVMIATYWAWNVLGLAIIYAIVCGRWEAGDTQFVGHNGTVDVLGFRSLFRNSSGGESGKKFEDETKIEENNHESWRPGRI